MPRKGLCNEEIMKAAAELVAEKGYDHFSLRELAARLGVQPASLYNHVKGIDEINMKLGLRAAKLLNRRLSDAVSGHGRSAGLTAGGKMSFFQRTMARRS